MAGILNSLFKMRRTLAQSVAFQTWVEAADEAHARQHCIIFQAEAEDLPEKYCGLYHADFRVERQALGLSAGCYVSRPVVVCHFEQETDPDTPMQEALVDLAEVVDAIMPDIEAKTWFTSWEPQGADPSMERLNSGKNLVTLRVTVEFADDEVEEGT
jgi:hypothetical protein